jgi:hypothetical protein
MVTAHCASSHGAVQPGVTPLQDSDRWLINTTSALALAGESVIDIVPYSQELKSEWDRFVSGSKNGTFLFNRDYMEYHSDRFRDQSLLIYDKKGKLISLLPANRRGDTLVSHEGLTYGGFISDKTMTVGLMLCVFEKVLSYLPNQGISKFLYKTIPHIYHRLPAEEDRYCLFRVGAALVRSDVTSVIEYSHAFSFQQRRLRGISKGLKNGLAVTRSQDFPQFWEILSRNLQDRHKVDPVHSLEEIQLLANRFPNEMNLYVCYQDSRILAGAVVYLSTNVCHVQYNAATDAGRRIGAIDLLFGELIGSHSNSKKFFDFGISTEDNGRYLNSGLVQYKEGFSARTVVHDFFEIHLSKHP